MIAQIVVEGQSLRWYGRVPTIADNSIKFVRFQFMLSPDWEGYYVTAQFTQGENTYNQLVDDGYCDMPEELGTGNCSVSLFGYKAGDVNRATVVPLYFVIQDSGFVSDGETPIPPTPDLYSQLVAYFSRVSGAIFTPIATEVADGVELSWENDREMPNPDPVKIYNGADGKDGQPGEKGDTGAQGIQGEKGDPFTYKDFTAEQLENLRGPKGEQGIQGEKGDPGEAGPKGDKGDKGDAGPQGEKGEKGDTGAQGIQGIQGIQGEKGDRGEKGDTGPQGPKGADGTMTFEDLTDEQKATLKGDTGPQGPVGPAGADGLPGKDGAAGKDGVSVTHVWDGTVLKVTSASGTSSANLRGAPGKDGTSVAVESVSESTADGGSNVVTFTDGKTLTVKNGSKGSDGQPGADGKDGQNGKSAYQYAAEAGFTGTAKEFSEKLAAVGSSGGQDRTHFELAPDGPVTSGVATWISYNALKGTDEVTVIYDGISFLCPVTFRESFPDGPDGLDESFFYTGNYNGSAPEYPFFIWGYRVSEVSTLGVGEGQHTISVIKKIDKKYLPDELFQEVGGDVDILPEEAVTLDEYAGWGRTISKRMTVGNTYIITIDGVEYERVAMYDKGFECPYIGNIALLGDTDHENANDDIFYFAVFSDGDIFFQMVTPDYENKTVTVAVREVAENSSGSGGAQPDWNAAEGEPGYIANRTHYTEKNTYPGKFYGNLDGYETIFVSDGTYLVKVSSEYYSDTALIGSTLKAVMGGAEQNIPLTAENVVNAVLVLAVEGSVVLMGTDPIVLSVPKDTSIQGAYLTTGTWFVFVEGQFYVKEIDCISSSVGETIHKIDRKYLPAFGINTEPITLTFYMEDNDWMEIGKGSAYGYSSDINLKRQIEYGAVRVKYNYYNRYNGSYKYEADVILYVTQVNNVGSFKLIGYLSDISYDYLVKGLVSVDDMNNNEASTLGIGLRMIPIHTDSRNCIVLDDKGTYKQCELYIENGEIKTRTIEN